MPKIIFILGQSGSGKGTQVTKILNLVKSEGKELLNLAMGDEIRGTIASLGPDHFFSAKMKEINDQGQLQAAFFPLIFFFNWLIKSWKGERFILIDGSPRSLLELLNWGSAIKKGWISSITIFEIDVSDDICRERLKARQDRPDTEDEKSRENKLAWYVEVRDFLSKNLPDGINLIRVNGEKPEDEVFEDLRPLVLSELKTD